MDRTNGEDQVTSSNTVTGDVSGTILQAGAVSGGLHFHRPSSRTLARGNVGRLAERPPWLARVLCADEVAGSGTLVDDSHVITFGLAEGSETLVQFPFSKGVARRATVISRDQSTDVCVLRLDESVALTSAPLSSPKSVSGHRFWAHGFPDGRCAVDQVHGTLGGCGGPGGEWILADFDDPPVAGLFGAPVFDCDVEAVVGIVSKGHVLPASYLSVVCPSMTTRVGWRLDLEPSLKTHWLPRARGSEVESDSGMWYFTGRHAARQAICDWLTDSEYSCLVVTGGPGSGKSALLAHLLLASDPVLGGSVPRTGPQPPTGVFDFAIHAAGLSRDEVVRRLASAVGVEADTPSELVVALRERREAGHEPVTIVVDAVEEAATVDEARHIATLFRTLADARAARVLAGVRTAPPATERARVLTAFGTTATRIDLESRRFLRNHDIADYVERRLAGEEAGPVRYRDRAPAELTMIARSVASKARYNFLIAQLTTRWLTHPTTPALDLDNPSWDQGLPETIGQALDAYLDTCGPDTALVRRLLTSLAFSRGSGLPCNGDRTWITIADALHPTHTHTLVELDAVFHGAANYLIERADDHHEHPTYRLYHDALDEHLREQCLHRSPQHAILSALADSVPVRDSRRDWAAAAPYITSHLVGHAAAAGMLDELLGDIGLLVHAAPGRLLVALSNIATAQGKIVAAVYRMSHHRHHDAEPWERCRILALDAARLSVWNLRDQFNATQVAIAAPGQRHAWRVRFATGHTLPSNTVAVFADGTSELRDIAATRLDGRLVAVCGSADGTVRLWDLVHQRQLGEPLTGGVTAMATAELDGRPAVVTCTANGTVQIWDVKENQQLGTTRTGHVAPVCAVAATDLQCGPVTIAASRTGEVTIWDLTGQRRLGQVHAGRAGPVHSIIVTELHERLVAVSAHPGTIRIWDPISQCQVGEVFCGGFKELTKAQFDGRSCVLAVDHEGVEVWDLDRLRRLGRVNVSDVELVAVTELNTRSVLVTSTASHLQIWDLADIEPIVQFHTGPVRGLAVAELDNVPIAITIDGSHMLHMWYLTEAPQVGQPIDAHANDISHVVAARAGSDPVVITTAHHDQTVLWDVDQQRKLCRIPVGNITAAVVTRFRRLPLAVFFESGSKTVLAWDLTKRRQIKEYQLELPTWGTSITEFAAFDRRGRLIVATASNNHGVLRVWDLRKERQVSEFLTGGTDSTDHGVTGLALTELGDKFVAVTAKNNGTLELWNLSNYRRLATMNTGRIKMFELTELDGLALAVILDFDQRLQVWNIRERRPLCEPFADSATNMAVGRLHDRPIVVTSHTGNAHRSVVQVWNLSDGRRLDEINVPRVGGTRIAAKTPIGVDSQGTVTVGFGSDMAVFEPTPSDEHPASPGTLVRPGATWWTKLRRR